MKISLVIAKHLFITALLWVMRVPGVDCGIYAGSVSSYSASHESSKSVKVGFSASKKVSHSIQHSSYGVRKEETNRAVLNSYHGTRNNKKSTQQIVNYGQSQATRLSVKNREQSSSYVRSPSKSTNSTNKTDIRSHRRIEVNAGNNTFSNTRNGGGCKCSDILRILAAMANAY
jgi:hypothetical protein